MTQLTCPECGRVIAHEQEVVAQRSLSNHRWWSHQVRSPKAIEEAERIARRKKKLAAEAKLEATVVVDEPVEVPAGTPGATQPDILARLGPQPALGTAGRAAWQKARWRLLNI